MRRRATVAVVTPEMIAGIVQAIASGVERVSYADRTVQYPSFDDLRGRLEYLLSLDGAGGRPTRRVACFSKGLETHCGAGVEHQELGAAVDVLFSRGAPVSAQRTEDVDWNRAR